MDAVIPLAVKSLEGNHLAPRGCLVRVRCGTDQNSPTERWFAVGSYPQRSAEVAVRNIPQIESTNVVFARRALKRAEIEGMYPDSYDKFRTIRKQMDLSGVFTNTLLKQFFD